MAVNVSEITGESSFYTEEMVTQKPVTRLAVQEQGTISHVPENSLLASLGLRTGKTVQLKAKQLMNGPLICSIDGRNVAISRDIAENVVVTCR